MGGLSQWLDDCQSVFHFIKHTSCSIDNKLLLFINNYKSHVSIKSLRKSKNYGMILFTFPPYCSHKLQPLNVSVLLMQKFLQCHLWMISNSEKTLSIYNIACLSSPVFKLVFILKSIVFVFLTLFICFLCSVTIFLIVQ